MSARLLWVDDEIDLLRPHCLFLEKRGYDITTASNGNDAVELCRTQRFRSELSPPSKRCNPTCPW